MELEFVRAELMNLRVGNYLYKIGEKSENIKGIVWSENGRRKVPESWSAM